MHCVFKPRQQHRTKDATVSAGSEKSLDVFVGASAHTYGLNGRTITSEIKLDFLDGRLSELASIMAGTTLSVRGDRRGVRRPVGGEWCGLTQTTFQKVQKRMKNPLWRTENLSNIHKIETLPVWFHTPPGSTLDAHHTHILQCPA